MVGAIHCDFHMIQIPRGVRLAFAHWIAYAIWIALFKLVALSLVTYVLMSSQARFQDIGDAFGSNEIPLIGLGSALYLILLRFLNPLVSVSTEEIFTPIRFEKRFVPGFFSGSVLALIAVLAFLLAGLYRYLGSYIHFDDAPLALADTLIRALSLGILVYCEEFLFRRRILNHLRQEMPELAAALLTGIGFCAIKAIQFDLGLMQLLTLFLISYSLSLRTLAQGDFAWSAGFWAGLLIVFHPLLSLPVLGNEFQGIVIVKYYSQDPTTGIENLRLLTGGLGGPLSSLPIQIVFLIDIVRSVLKNKNSLLNRKTF